MQIKVGTFNLNNLFSRYNFKAEVGSISEPSNFDTVSEIHYEFGPNDAIKIRSYRGRLVKSKETGETETIAGRIKEMDVDVLAVQEVEDIDTLKEFNKVYLNGLYRYVILIEGNDNRFIDIGLLSKLPTGGITSWQTAVHKDDPVRPVFGRDLLQVDILNASRSKKLFTIFNNHLKSHYIDFKDDPVSSQNSNNLRRQRQADVLARIVRSQTRPDSAYIVLGDMNDPPDSPFLEGFTEDPEMNLVNSLQSPKETRPAKADTPPPPSAAWTHRFKPTGKPALYELYDQIWTSPSLAEKQIEAWIDRRKLHGGDGSDHDPAWVVLNL